MFIIGDVHGKINNYWKLLQKIDNSIQIGDFGFKKQHDWHLKNIDKNHKILFGNHDYYPYLNEKHSLGNFTYIEKYDMFCVRGALSIDSYQRTIDVDYFTNEELNYGEMQEAIDLYLDKKPSIVLSHDCPSLVRKELFNITDKSITSQGLQYMFENHQPYKWIFGHHHRSKNEMIENTNFICLEELETYKL